jgi:hypothetical protein
MRAQTGSFVLQTGTDARTLVASIRAICGLATFCDRLNFVPLLQRLQKIQRTAD